MAATIEVTSIDIESNYHVLQNPDADTALVINQLIPPSWAEDGFLLLIEFDNDNKGGGIFLKNKTSLDADANMHLQCWQQVQYPAVRTKMYLSHDLPYYIYHSVANCSEALNAIAAEDTVERDAALANLLTNLNGIHETFLDPSSEIGQEIKMVINGSFAYGLGGIDFLQGLKGELIAGTTYFDYSSRRPFVILIWDGGIWKQPSPLGINAIS